MAIESVLTSSRTRALVLEAAHAALRVIRFREGAERLMKGLSEQARDKNEAAMLTRHGRATPLVWLTVNTSTLKDRRNEYEYQVLVRLADALPVDIKVCIVADRGFGDQKLYRMLSEELKFDYVIRFRGNITVTTAAGEARSAAAWVGPGGRARILRGALVTAERYQVGTVLCVQDKEMQQAWCLATSSTDVSAKALMSLYGKRWAIECGLRDTKDLRFGMGMGSIHVSTPDRRDRMWLLNALAIALLTLLGAAGEALGYDRYLKSNTTQRRTHSLFRQGCMLYELISTMPELRLLPLIERFAVMFANSLQGRGELIPHRVCLAFLQCTIQRRFGLLTPALELVERHAQLAREILGGLAAEQAKHHLSLAVHAPTLA